MALCEEFRAHAAIIFMACIKKPNQQLVADEKYLRQATILVAFFRVQVTVSHHYYYSIILLGPIWLGGCCEVGATA